MAAPVRILHLHSTFAPGGKELRAVRLMNAFGDRAVHTIVSGMPDQLGARDAIAPGIQYEIAQDPPPLTGRPSIGRYERLAKLMSRFDLVLTYNWGAMDAVMARRAFNKALPPLIHHEDGFNNDEAEGLKATRNWFRRGALDAATALVVPSHTLEDIALTTWKQPRPRVHRISNGIPVARYAEKPRPDAIPGLERREGETVIGTVAGLRAVKDLPALVRAVAGVPARVRLVIVGDGPERAVIEAQAEAMAMSSKLVMPGHLPDPARYMGLFDIFALSSKSEQQPISVMEAMAAGLPIASMPVGDVPRMVADINLPYVTGDRTELRLRDSIAVLATHPEGSRNVGVANRAKAMAEFDESMMICRYKSLYENAIGRPGAFG
jgi:L-malate glycosyltransferase